MMAVGKVNARYVLVSACRNESDYIDGLIETVSMQTFKPISWIIVDDGSTDDTYDRVQVRANSISYINLVRMPKTTSRSFASKVYAIKFGYELAHKIDFNYIGILDADIRLENDYYQIISQYLIENPTIGLAGGSIIDKGNERFIDYRKGSEDYHVAGGVQFFRRECFDQIGGYLPTDVGGEDTIAETMALMHGWKVKTIPEKICIHLRPEGAFSHGAFRKGMVWGNRFYKLGYHPLYYLCQCVRRIGQRPILLASAWMLLGFFVANIKNEPRYVSDDFVLFLRKQQMRRIKNIFRS